SKILLQILATCWRVGGGRAPSEERLHQDGRPMRSKLVRVFFVSQQTSNKLFAAIGTFVIGQSFEFIGSGRTAQNLLEHALAPFGIRDFHRRPNPSSFPGLSELVVDKRDDNAIGRRLPFQWPHFDNGACWLRCRWRLRLDYLRLEIRIG